MGLLQHPRIKGVPKKAENVATLGSPALGDREAPVTLIEFTDYECPFCKKFYKKGSAQIEKRIY